MANTLYDTGIKMMTSFSATGNFPVDGKFIVETLTERDAHVNQNRAYHGMIVYVKEKDMHYKYGINGWEEFGFNLNNFQSNLYDKLDSLDDTLALTAKQGKILNDKITNHINNANVHITSEERELIKNLNNRLLEVEAKLKTAVFIAEK